MPTDPHLSTAKRQQRSHVLNSHMAHASLERQLLAAQTAKSELESKLREKDLAIERLESDRRWLAEREKEEREEKEQERAERAEEKVRRDIHFTSALTYHPLMHTRYTAQVRRRYPLPTLLPPSPPRRARRPARRTHGALTEHLPTHRHPEIGDIDSQPSSPPSI